MAISAEAAKQLRDVIDETLKNPEVVVEEPAGGGVPEDFARFGLKPNRFYVGSPLRHRVSVGCSRRLLERGPFCSAWLQLETSSTTRPAVPPPRNGLDAL